MLHVSLDDKNKLYLKKFNTKSQVLAFAFDFLPDDVATSWVALLRLAVNKNTHSEGQLLLKYPFGVFKSTKKPTKFL